jgi:hypothetical protein
MTLRAVDEKVKTFEDQWKRMDALTSREYQMNDPGFLAEEYAERYGVSLHIASRRLTRLVASGDLIQGWRYVNRRKRRVYRFPEE